MGSMKIPLDDDLGIAGKMAVRYHREKSRVNMALVVLSQRVVIEKAKRYCQRRNAPRDMASIRQTLDKMLEDRRYAEQWADRVGCWSSVGRVWRNYGNSILLDD